MMTLFDTPEPTGIELARLGMNKAEAAANLMVEDWSVKALAMGVEYLKLFGAGYQFRGEQLRNYCEANGIPEPPSRRAYGSIIMKLAKKGLIKKVGYSQVNNTKAHSANCSLWEINQTTNKLKA